MMLEKFPACSSSNLVGRLHDTVRFITTTVYLGGGMTKVDSVDKCSASGDLATKLS
jgi:hypothetical protein